MNNRFFMGFTCWQDMLTTIVGKAVVFKNALTITFYAIMAGAGWICNDTKVIGLLFTLMVADFITGVIKASKNKTITSYKLPRVAFNMFCRFMMIGLAFRIGVLWPILAYLHLHECLLIYFVLTEFISVAENLHAIDTRIVSDKLMKYLQSAADADAVVAKYMKKFGDDEDKDDDTDDDTDDTKDADPIATETKTDDKEERCSLPAPTAVIDGVSSN